MQRTVQDLLKDAGEIARRTNTQVLLLGGGLLLVWTVNLEDGFRNVQRQIVTYAEYEMRDENLKQIVDKRKDKLAEYKVAVLKLLEKARTETRKEVVDDYGFQKLKLQNRIDKIQDQLSNAGKLQQFLVSAKSETQKTFQERITFEMGQGLKLPFSFGIASLMWLIILIFLLCRIGLQRWKFWRLITEAVLRHRAQGNSDLGQQLSDLPIWLAPVPRGGATGQVTGDDLAAVVGWRLKSLQALLLSFLFGFVIFAVFRVAYIGLIVNGMAVDRLNGSTLWGSGILAGAAICLIFLISLNLSSTIPDTDDAADISDGGRRKLILVTACGIGGMLLVLRAPYASAYFDSRSDEARKAAHERFRRYTRRQSRVADLSNSGLKPGVYKNVRSGAVHYLGSDGHVRGTDPKLNAKSLQPVEFQIEMASPSKNYEMPLPVNLRVRNFRNHVLSEGPLLEAVEQVALSKVMEGRPDVAVLLLIDTIRNRFSSKGAQSAKPVLRQLDLAAGLAIRYDLTARLDELAKLALEVQSYIKDKEERQKLARRVERWKGSNEEDWRNYRWRNQPHPLRWNGKKYNA